MEPYVNTGRKDYLKELLRVRKQEHNKLYSKPSGMYVGEKITPQHMNPSDFVEGMDARPKGEIYQDMEKSQKAKQKQTQKSQTKSKQTLLTNQPVKSKGGKSGGGGGGKWGWFNRMRHSPWNILRNDKSY